MECSNMYCVFCVSIFIGVEFILTHEWWQRLFSARNTIITPGSRVPLGALCGTEVTQHHEAGS